MTFIKPCYFNAEPVTVDSVVAPEHSSTIRVVEPDIFVVGELVGCLRCQAYLDGSLNKPSDGFCPDCGTHIKTLKKQQAMHDIIARRYESMEAL